MITQTSITSLSYQIIGCAIEVHKHLGPGLLESVYETCFIDELKAKGLDVKAQLYVPISYKGKDLGGILKLDVLVEDLIIVELKAVEIMIPLYQAQLLSYLKLTNKFKGLLINFNTENVSKDIISLVTPSFKELPE
jgi:GxxExxY protein